MLANIVVREIHHHIMSLSLHLILILSMLLFGLGTVSFVKSHAKDKAKYDSYYAEDIERWREVAESNLTLFATYKRDLILEPPGNSFITDAREKYFPNRFSFSAFNVFGFDVKSDAANPYLNSFQELNWGFIVAILISFAVLIFSYDAVSGEKQSRTLALALSNSVSRGIMLWGKFLAIIITTTLVLVPGIALSMIILLLSGTIAETSAVLAEIAAFMLVVILFVACIASFGLLSSVACKRPNVSLLVALTLWLGFVIVVPNTTGFWTQTFFPIDSNTVVTNKIESELQEIEDNAPDGSHSHHSQNPFRPEHELLANRLMKRLNSEKKFRDAQVNDMMRQYEQARMLNSISPVSLFERLCEAVTGRGYVRFTNVWNDIHVHQAQFLAFFKDIDANDPDSPHWYNPEESISTTKKPIKFEEAPQFMERRADWSDRFSAGIMSLMMMFFYTVSAFSLSFVLFLQFDVR